MTIKRVEMERRYDGTFPPNRFRYVCDSGHHHPSRRHAGKCNDRQHKASVQAADRAKGRPVAESVIVMDDGVEVPFEERVRQLVTGAAIEVGDDGTGDLGVIVRQALRDSTEVMVGDIVAIVREARADAAMEASDS